MYVKYANLKYEILPFNNSKLCYDDLFILPSLYAYHSSFVFVNTRYFSAPLFASILFLCMDYAIALSTCNQKALITL